MTYRETYWKGKSLTGREGAPPPSRSNFFYFHDIFDKIGQITDLHPMGYSGSTTASKFRSVQYFPKQFQFFNHKYCKNVANPPRAPPYTVTDPPWCPSLVVSAVCDLCLHLILTCKSDPLKQAEPCYRAWYTDQGTGYRYRPVWGYHGTPEGLHGCLEVPWDSWRVTWLSGGTMRLLKGY